MEKLTGNELRFLNNPPPLQQGCIVAYTDHHVKMIRSLVAKGYLRKHTPNASFGFYVRTEKQAPA
jgi:hypothetical protein